MAQMSKSWISPGGWQLILLIALGERKMNNLLMSTFKEVTGLQ